MANFLERFWGDESGNTTIDWLVLTAGIVLLGAGVMAAVYPSTTNYADEAGAAMEQSEVTQF